MGIVSAVVDSVAPLFLMVSPITSYADQILSIHRNKSSAGFSLDIPLIMLVASILKIFYWFGAYYSYSLLFQACLMLVVQLVLLKVALDNRPALGVRDGLHHAPFSSIEKEGSLLDTRPYDFWQWRTKRPYFQFILYLTLTLLAIHILLPPVSGSPFYISFLGYLGLAIEAVLPIPQILTNHRARSCKGFRLSVLANWLMGDMFKMSYFFLSAEVIPWAFRMCGIFQMCCDIFLGVQYWMFGDGTVALEQGPPRPVADRKGNIVAMSEKDQDRFHP